MRAHREKLSTTQHERLTITETSARKATGRRSGGFAGTARLPAFWRTLARQWSYPEPDQPVLAAGVQMLDLTIESRALGLTTTTRLVFPTGRSAGIRLPVAYLLHDAGESYRTWTNETQVADLAAAGVILAMPDAAGSFYVDEARRGAYFEHFLAAELSAAVSHRLPFAATGRDSTALIGAGLGGFGAVTLALKHPHRYGFAAALGANLELPAPVIRWRSPLASWRTQRRWGAAGSPMRRNNDPFALTQALEWRPAPFLWLSCGLGDLSLTSNRRFAAMLEQNSLRHALAEPQGGHNWAVWDSQLPSLSATLLRFLSEGDATGRGCDETSAP